MNNNLNEMSIQNAFGFRPLCKNLLCIKTFILYFSVCGQSEDDRRAVSNFQFSDGNVNTTISKVRLKI